MRIALNGLFLAEPATGTGQYLRELVSAMRAISPQDEFVFIAPRPDPTAPAPIEVHPTRAKRENFAKLEFEQVTFPQACAEIRTPQTNFTLAHVPHFGSPLFPTHPTVVTVHDLIPMVRPAYRGSARVRLYTRLAGLGAKRADAILADSFASARDIETRLHIPREKIHVVHLATHPRFQPPNPSEMERVRAKYNLPPQFVLYLGGFDVRKNVGRVIETFARLETGDWRPGTTDERLATGDWRLETGDWRLETGAEQSTIGDPRLATRDPRFAIRDTRLVVAGKLPERDSAFFPDPRGMAERLGVLERTHFTGFVAEEDKPALYAAARVFLFPSHYEGFGLPVLEAMACGTPVISANTASLPEVVGDAGILLAPDDADGWAEALRSLLTDDARWNDLRVRGLAQAKQFSWERAARETLAVYRSVV